MRIPKSCENVYDSIIIPVGNKSTKKPISRYYFSIKTNLPCTFDLN